MDYLVNSQEELNEALSNAGSGDTIVLSKFDGSYTIRMDGLDYDGEGLTFTSQDPEDMAIVETVWLSNSSNIHFTHLDVNSHTYPTDRADWMNDLIISNSEDISFSQSKFHGDATEARLTEDSYRAETFATVRETSGFVFEDNEVSNYNFGFTLLESTDVKISNNDMHSLQGDPIRMGGVQNVEITDNYMHDLLGSDYSLNHMDMIQIWSTNTTLVTKDVTISGNIMDAGNGVATQSVFIRNEKVDTAENPNPYDFYSNIVIENNLIYNGHKHGITVGDTNGLVISNNTLITNTQSSMIVGAGQKNVTYNPTINVSNSSTDVVISNNVTSAVSAPDSATVTGNYEIDYVNQSAENYVGNVILFAENGGDVSVADLQFNPEGPLGGSDIGADVSQFDQTPNTLTPVIIVEKIDGKEQHLRLSAKYTADENGQVNDSNASFEWTFEDGTVLKGQTVEMKLESAGQLDLELTVTTDTASETVEKAILVEDPVLFSISADAGKIVDELSKDTEVVVKNLDSIDDAINIGAGSTFEISRNNSEIFSLDQFSLSFDMKRDSISGGSEILAILHKSMKVTITPNGELTFLLINNEGVEFELTSSGANLNDNDWHNIALSFDGHAGELLIVVNDVVVGQMQASGSTQDKEFWGLVFGHPWSGPTFTGQLDNLKMTSDPYNTASPDTDDWDDSSAGDSNVMGAFENIRAGSGNNTIYGNGVGNIIELQNGNDVAFGYDGNDRIEGGAGNDWLAGGAGADLFVFKDGQTGADTISDFEAGASTGDVIQFDVGTFANFNALINASSDDGVHTTITIDEETTILLQNVLVSSLHQNDFSFV